MAQSDNLRQMKIEAAKAALGEVRSGMKLGLGTGSTAREFVALLGDSIRAGTLTAIRAVCTSKETESQASSLGIPLEPLSRLGALDLSVGREAVGAVFYRTGGARAALRFVA